MKKIQILLLSLVLLPLVSYSDEISVVINPAFSNDITEKEMIRIFTGRSKTLSPVNLVPSEATRGQFDQQAVGRTSAQLKSLWSKLVFTGKAKMPEEFASDSDVLNHVAANASSIGYVKSSSVTDQVKVILTY